MGHMPSIHDMSISRVMSPTPTTSSAPWLIRTCRACHEIMSGPTVVCEACHSQVHGHCMALRGGHAACNACVGEIDFAFASQAASNRLAYSGLDFGRLMKRRWTACRSGGWCSGHRHSSWCCTPGHWMRGGGAPGAGWRDRGGDAAEAARAPGIRLLRPREH